MKETGFSPLSRSHVLLLVRHAEAIDKHVGLPDEERCLTTKGMQQARAVAARLAEIDLYPDRLISSRADRALETMHLLAERIKYPVLDIRIAPELYPSESTSAVVRMLSRLPEDLSVVGLGGHNPQLSALANRFVPTFDSSLPKGGIAVIAFNTDSWTRISPGSGQLLHIMTPSPALNNRRRVA